MEQQMKVAIIGRGKTGQAVIDYLPETQVSGVYSRENPVTVAALQAADVAIVFVPGAAMDALIPILLAAEIPVICGATGIDWPAALSEQMAAVQTRWIMASNFSLGMSLMRRCIKLLGRASQILPNPDFHIHEVHHVHKQDTPSGTALSWQQWLNQPCEVTAEREGDVKGVHVLTVETPAERMTLKHESLDRQLFAQGAVWAAHYVLSKAGHSLAPGMHYFDEIIDELLSV